MHSTAVFAASSIDQNYDVEIEYPVFRTDQERGLNSAVRLLIETAANEIITAARDRERICPLLYRLVGSFIIALRTPPAVSLRFSFTSYTGGAHSNNITEVVNYSMDRCATFGVEDLFAVPELGIKKLSEHSITALLDSEGCSRDEANVKRGAGPEARNFANFNLSTEGVLITFDEYQVGCYAEGGSEVLVPYAVLRPVVSDLVETLIVECGGVDA